MFVISMKATTNYFPLVSMDILEIENGLNKVNACRIESYPGFIWNFSNDNYIDKMENYSYHGPNRK